jgi:uncharacterized delta-60 repeat protein
MGLTLPGVSLHSSGVSSLTRQNDGKLVAAGTGSFGGLGTFVVARRRGDGLLDAAFGNGGVAIGILAGEGTARDVAVQPDGRIVVAGGITPNGTTGRAMALMRFLPNGEIDSSFGVGGRVTAGIEGGRSEAAAAVVLSDGKILVAGSRAGDGPPPNSGDATLSRFLPDGRLDPDFGSGGHVLISGAQATDMVLQDDGKILLTGRRTSGVSSPLWLARCEGDGTLDVTFGSGGEAVSGEPDSWGMRLALQGDGKILVAGGVRTPGVFDNGAFLVTRWLPNGKPDARFNGTGAVIINPTQSTEPSTFVEQASGVAVQPDGKIVAGGNGNNQFCVMRLHPDGKLDTGFHEEGLVFTNAGDSISEIDDLLLQADGRIVAGGRMGFPQNPQAMFLAGYAGTTGPGVLAAECPPGKPLPVGGKVEAGAVLRGSGPTVLHTTMTIRNQGTESLTNLIAVVDGGGATQFSMTSPPATLNPGDTWTITVSFRPLAAVSDFKPRFLLMRGGIPGSCLFYCILHGATEAPVATLEVSCDGQPLPEIAEAAFGLVTASKGPQTKTILLTNTGNVDLLLQNVLFLPGGTPEDFSVTRPKTSLLAPDASVPLEVTFSPLAAGRRTAKLRVLSTDTLKISQDITLSGHVFTSAEMWRVEHFGWSANEDAAADAADPDGDGISNFLERATLTDPVSANPPPGTAAMTGRSLDYMITRSTASAEELTWELEWSDTLQATAWNKADAPPVILSDDGIRQQVKFSIRAGESEKRFVRLRVTGK